MLTPEEKRERRRARYRRNRANWKAANHQKALDIDRASRQRRRLADPEKWRADQRRRRERMRASGKIAEYMRHYLKTHRNERAEYARRRNLMITAAARYLRSQGLLEWWGPQETTKERREAAYRYVRRSGLL